MYLPGLTVDDDIATSARMMLHETEAFTPVRPGTPDAPATIKIALLRYTRGEDGRLLITPECTAFEEIEGQINSSQDELDELRERARRAFLAAP